MIINYLKITISSVFFFLFITLLCTKANSNRNENKNILYINSYQIGNTYADELTRGIRNVFDSSRYINLYIDYLDAKRNTAKNYFDIFNLYLKEKYKSVDFDIILCSDNDALDFVLLRRKDPFYNKPVVFCGINNTDDYNFKNDSIYGVKENVDLKKTIDLIIKTKPDLKSIYIVFDQTTTSTLYKREFEYIAKEKRGVVKLKYIDNLNVDSIPEVFSSIKNPDVIYYLGVFKDKNGCVVKPDIIAREILKYTKVPVYGNFIELKVKGMLGTVTALGFYQGKEMANLAYRILYRNSNDSIPKLIKKDPNIIFDYKLIKKYNLDLNNFPESTIILNNPKGIIEKYKREVILISITFFVLIIIIIVLSRNIYKRVKTENELIVAKQRAEESDLLKSAFLANVSHETRTPLNAIIGFSSLLLDDYDITDEAKSYIKYIVSAGENLNNLLNDIIEISRIEAGQLEIKKGKTNIYNLLFDIKIQHTGNKDNLAGHKNKLIFDNEEGPAAFIYTDTYRLKQIFLNLISNAIKFTHDGIINIGYKKERSNLIFYVKDTGIGIPEDKINFIFQRFTKIEDLTDKLYRGTGLGLTITQKLVNLLGGKIWVESIRGKGSSFYFTLSGGELSTHEIENEFVIKNEKPPSFKEKTILVAEDVDSNFYFLEKLLKKFHTNVVRAKNGKEAVSLFKEKTNTIDMILMDIKMPVMDGHEACRIIKKINNIPIVAITAYYIDDNEEEIMKSGFNECISKPFNNKQLLDVLLKYL